MLIKLKSGNTIAAGRTTEPEYKEVGAKQTPVCEFSIAAAEYEDDLGQKKTVWLNCKVWRDKAVLASQQIHKGDTVAVLGVTKNREWTGRDGALRTSEETTLDWFSVMPKAPADTLDALMQRPGVTVQPAADPVRAAFAEFEDDDDGEFPF